MATNNKRKLISSIGKKYYDTINKAYFVVMDVVDVDKSPIRSTVKIAYGDNETTISGAYLNQYCGLVENDLNLSHVPDFIVSYIHDRCIYFRDHVGQLLDDEKNTPSFQFYMKDIKWIISKTNLVKQSIGGVRSEIQFDRLRKINQFIVDNNIFITLDNKQDND